MIRLEHANLAVRDVDAMIAFVKTAFPEFRIRGEGTLPWSRRWVHVGSDEAYLALCQAHHEPAESWQPYGGKPGVNHLGFEVDDVEALRARMLEQGYRESTVPNGHPFRKRVYFHDPEGNDWEFVEYRSDEARERHDYGIPDVA